MTEATANPDGRQTLAKLLAEMLDLNDDDMAQPITSDILVNPYEAADYILSTLSAIPATGSGETVPDRVKEANAIADCLTGDNVYYMQRMGGFYDWCARLQRRIRALASPANPAEAQAVEVGE